MPSYLQTGRPIQLTTPLGRDKLLATELTGREAISELFDFDLMALAEHNTEVPFEKLLGQEVIVRIEPKDGDIRYLSGIVKTIERRERQLHEFVRYRLELVPQFWLLTRQFLSRIFQQMTVPDILKKVLTGLNVDYQLQGDFKSREYCVQYRESSFDFASRLMEEEGIYYLFKHTAGGHQMVLANTPQSHPPLPYAPQAVYEDSPEGTPSDDRINEWFTSQAIRPGKYTVWDEHNQLFNKHLEAQKTIQPSAPIGTLSYQLTAGGASLEVYDFPGEYSRHFDGVNKSGGDQPDHLQWIFQENERIAGIRMQQQAVETLLVQGAGCHAAFTAGHKFDLTSHPTDNGPFIVTSVEHSAKQSIGADETEHTWDYSNRFTCIPFSLPYRPLRKTPAPSVRGVQLATVVGPKGEEIFTDKYGRIKVQFHWDREGKYDLDSSCWLRVGTYWAGKQWGAIHIPRIGQEVIVAFEEGDPDHPIVVGSVYNSDQMPPYTLPENKTMSGIRSRSTPKADNDMLNEIRLEDKKGEEHIFIHAQKDMHLRVKNDRMEWIGDDTHLTVGHDRFVEIDRDEHVMIKRDRFEELQRDEHVKIVGKSATEIQGSYSLHVAGSSAEKFDGSHSEECGGSIYVKSGMKVVIEAGAELTFKVGGNFIDINSGGIFIVGSMVNINSGGAAGSGALSGLVPPTAPKKSIMPITTKPTEATVLPSAAPTAAAASAGAGSGPGADAGPTHAPNAPENKDKKHWVEVELTDDAGQPVPGESVECKLPDGSYSTGTTDEKGKYKVEHIDGGQVEISFPNLDKDAWEPK
jgi:type VI secretion system secreted protein VgrG